MQSIIKIKKNGSFSEEHKETVKAFLRQEAFPQLYTNVEFKSLEFRGTHLFDASTILRNSPGTQETRYNGNNPKRNDLRQDITENGWQLYQRPISLRELPNGSYVFLDGRTKDGILNELKFKNRIVNVYRIDDQEVEEFCERLNAGEDNPPAGLMSEQDLVGMLNRQIGNNFIELDIDDIRNSINKACGKGRFSSNKREKLAWQIYYQQLSTQNNKLLPKSWSGEKQVSDWLKTNNYIDVGNVIYLPYSSTSPPKAIIAAATAAMLNPGKEIRVVVYIINLTGYDLTKSYVSTIEKFKREWKRHLSELSNAFFKNTAPTINNVKLYAAAPSNIEGLCDNMNELIIFGKNDQKISSSYWTNNTLSQYFNVDFETEEDEFVE
jgi:hypothetical protein